MKNLKKLNDFTIIGLMCFLVMIFTFANPNVAQAEVDRLKVLAYVQSLNDLDGERKHIGKVIIPARDLYFKTFTEQDSLETRDAAFVKFHELYLTAAIFARGDEIYENLKKKYKKENDPDVIKVKEIAALQGLQLVYSKGSYEPKADSNYLIKTFGKFISPATRAYLTYTKGVDDLGDNEHITAGFEELRKVIALGELVVKQYPESHFAPFVKEDLPFWVRYYIFGKDKLHAFEGSTRNMLAEAKSSFNNFLKENKDSTYYPLMQYVYNTLKENNFKYTDEAMAAIKKELYK